ncbi:MAG: cupin domain-containing protein [Armatimonadetes bacterium]|nr:cupin domain-containing protein [Armatimonadota bacterium]
MKGLTLQNVADQTGLTKGYLSKIETSGKAAPVPTLARIAAVIGVPLAELFGGVEKTERISVVRADERQQLARGAREFGYMYELLCVGIDNKYMEPYILTIPANTTCPTTEHDGEELLFVLDGVMKFRLGEHEFQLQKGDSVYFDASIRHFGEAVGSVDVKCVMVVHSEPGSGPE